MPFLVVYGKRLILKLESIKNSRATAIFNKSYELYHLERVKKGSGKAPEIYLMEGFMDVIAAYRAGIENAVASMGTALTSEHVEHLKRFTKKVIVTYDGDRLGKLPQLKPWMSLKIYLSKSSDS